MSLMFQMKFKIIHKMFLLELVIQKLSKAEVFPILHQSQLDLTRWSAKYN